MPKVSVIIPTYNREAVVVEAIQSVLEQTITDLEVIVVDDGSTDNTRQAVDALADPRIRYLFKENSGPAGARNFGLDQGQGDYIAFLDSDDYWPDDYLEKMLAALTESPDFGLAYASIKLVDKNGYTIRVRNPENVCKSGWITRDLFSKGFVSPVAVLIQQRILEGFRFEENLSTAEDSDFFLRLSLKTMFLYVPEVFVSTRLSKNSQCLEAGLNYNRILSLERFYWRCGGKKHVPFFGASKKLSRQYRKVAKRHRRLNDRKAAMYLYQKAIRYRPFDVRLYIGWFRSIILAGDRCQDWQMPSKLTDISN